MAAPSNNVENLLGEVVLELLALVCFPKLVFKQDSSAVFGASIRVI